MFNQRCPRLPRYTYDRTTRFVDISVHLRPQDNDFWQIFSLLATAVRRRRRWHTRRPATHINTIMRVKKGFSFAVERAAFKLFAISDDNSGIYDFTNVTCTKYLRPRGYIAVASSSTNHLTPAQRSTHMQHYTVCIPHQVSGSGMSTTMSKFGVCINPTWRI